MANSRSPLLRRVDPVGIEERDAEQPERDGSVRRSRWESISARRTDAAPQRTPPALERHCIREPQQNLAGPGTATVGTRCRPAAREARSRRTLFGLALGD